MAGESKLSMCPPALTAHILTRAFGGVEESDLLQALDEPSIDTQGIPLRRDGQMNERGVALFDRGIEVTKRLVKMTCLTEKQGELHRWTLRIDAKRILHNRRTASGPVDAFQLLD